MTTLILLDLFVSECEKCDEIVNPAYQDQHLAVLQWNITKFGSFVICKINETTTGVTWAIELAILTSLIIVSIHLN